MGAKRWAEQRRGTEGENESSIGCREKIEEMSVGDGVDCIALTLSLACSASTIAISSTPLYPHRMRSDVWRKLVQLQTGTARVGKVQPRAISSSRTTNLALNRTGRRLHRETLYKLSLMDVAEMSPPSRCCTVRSLPPNFSLEQSTFAASTIVIFSYKRPYHFSALPADGVAPLLRAISASPTCTDRRPFPQRVQTAAHRLHQAEKFAPTFTVVHSSKTKTVAHRQVYLHTRINMHLRSF